MSKVNPIRAWCKHYTWEDYRFFLAALRIPTCYLRYVPDNYKSLSEVPKNLSKIVTDTHNRHWKILMNRSADDLQQQVELLKMRKSGVPATFVRNTQLPSCSSEVLSAWSSMKTKAVKFAKCGRLVYMHSLQGTNSLLAATEIVKAALDEVPCYMIDFATFMDEVKTFDKSKKLETLDAAQLAVVYMIGTEYATEFVGSNLESFVKRRQVAGKTTILVSHLVPGKFKDRYGRALVGDSGWQAIVMKFDDPSVLVTINDLVKELEEE